MNSTDLVARMANQRTLVTDLLSSQKELMNALGVCREYLVRVPPEIDPLTKEVAKITVPKEIIKLIDDVTSRAVKTP